MNLLLFEFSGDTASNATSSSAASTTPALKPKAGGCRIDRGHRAPGRRRAGPFRACRGTSFRAAAANHAP